MNTKKDQHECRTSPWTEGGLNISGSRLCYAVFSWIIKKVQSEELCAAGMPRPAILSAVIHPLTLSVGAWWAKFGGFFLSVESLFMFRNGSVIVSEVKPVQANGRRQEACCCGPDSQPLCDAGIFVLAGLLQRFVWSFCSISSNETIVEKPQYLTKRAFHLFSCS